MSKITASFILSLVLISYAAFAQDIIVKKDNTEIPAKVYSISDTDIKYKKKGAFGWPNELHQKIGGLYDYPTGWNQRIYSNF